jgi:phosphate transport system permease protein
MAVLIFAVLLLALMALAYRVGSKRAFATGTTGGKRMNSLPSYYGAHMALWFILPAGIMFGLWSALQGSIVEGMVLSGLPAEVQALPDNELGLIMNDIRNLATGNITSGTPTPEITTAAERYASLSSMMTWMMYIVCVALGAAGTYFSFTRIRPDFRARNAVESIVMKILIVSSTIAIFTTIGIVLSLLFEASRFFAQIPITDFLFGLQWSPQIALRADQVGSSGAFGAVPIFAGTMLISFIAMCVAAPIGLFAAIYMSEYASPKFRAVIKPVLEILAGIPTVVYGFFAALTIAPLFHGWGASIGLDIASESALAAGVVMGVMIIPFVSSLSDDVISQVPGSLREGSYGLGATKSETIRKVILPAALPGIVGSLLLAVSRAIGETMIVVMAAGLAANLTANPFEAVTTVTVQIVTLLVGDQEFDSPKTLAAFALGLVLFFVTLCLNIIALHVVRKYREQYD